MKIELKDMLKIAGSAVALLFMAWMFFGHLNSRPNDSKNQYEELVQEFRKFEDRDFGFRKHPRSKVSRASGMN